VAKNVEGSDVTDGLTKRDQPDRSKIKMDEDYEVHYWTKLRIPGIAARDSD